MTLSVVATTVSAVSYSFRSDAPECPEGQEWGYLRVVALDEAGRVWGHEVTFAPRKGREAARRLADRVAEAGRIEESRWELVRERDDYYFADDEGQPRPGVRRVGA